MDWITRFAAYANGCMAKPLGFPDCNMLWGVLFLTVVTLGGVIALRVIYKNQQNQREEQRIIEEIILGRHRAADAFMAERGSAKDAPSSAKNRYGTRGATEAEHKDAFP